MTAEREREARDMLDSDARCTHPGGNYERDGGRMCQVCLDAYAAAVRAARDAEYEATLSDAVERAHDAGYARAIVDAIRCVEGVPKVPVMMTMLTENGAQSFHTTAATAPALDAALTRLRAMEGT